MDTTSQQPAGQGPLRETLKLQATLLFGSVALLWLIELTDALVFDGALDRYGVRPRSIDGLEGIVLAPLLHGGFAHLIANTGPLIVLGWLVMLVSIKSWLLVGALSTLVGGAGIWLIGATRSVHIGASIVVFGLLGYLLLRGYFERRVAPIAVSLIVGVAYGGALFGLLPGSRGVSWEGHLFGFIGGVLAARLTRSTPSQRDRQHDSAPTGRLSA